VGQRTLSRFSERSPAPCNDGAPFSGCNALPSSPVQRKKGCEYQTMNVMCSSCERQSHSCPPCQPSCFVTLSDTAQAQAALRAPPARQVAAAEPGWSGPAWRAQESDRGQQPLVFIRGARAPRLERAPAGGFRRDIRYVRLMRRSLGCSRADVAVVHAAGRHC